MKFEQKVSSALHQVHCFTTIASSAGNEAVRPKEKQDQMSAKFRGTITEKETPAVTDGSAGWFRGGVGGPGGEAARPSRSILPAPHSIFVRESQWSSGTGMRIPREEIDLLRRCLRARDVAILLMLAQHHYLTSDHIRVMFFPSLRATQMRLHWLTTKRQLLMRWRQLEPADYGWRRRPSLYTLSQRGATVLANYLKWDPRSLVRRSWHAAEQGLHLGHDLDVIGFFVGLIAESQELPNQGLYHWLGEDTLRRSYQEDGIEDLAPDGWGRYLTPAGEVMFTLEWDRGTETPRHLSAKVARYARHFANRGSDDVLFVAPSPVRERSIQTAINQGVGTKGRVKFWVTNTELLREMGPLGEVWLPQQGDKRISLSALTGRLRTDRRIGDCIGKLGWWNYRPGAGEGA